MPPRAARKKARSWSVGLNQNLCRVSMGPGSRTGMSESGGSRGPAALDVAAEALGDGEEDERLLLAQEFPALGVSHDGAWREEVAGRHDLLDEAARGRALAPVEDGPGDVGRLVREREAEEDEHHDGLDQHDADERLVVAHDLGLLPGDGRDVGPEAPAHARVSRERSARTISTAPNSTRKPSSGSRAAGPSARR